VKTIARFVRTTLAGGVLFLLPLVVLVMLLGKVAQMAHKLVAPLAERLPVESVIGLDTPRFLAVFLIVLFCFLAGVLARTALARSASNRVESVLANLPGYEFVRSITARLLTPEQTPSRPVVLARIEDAWQIGVLVERVDEGHVAVFVPGTPDPKSGAVYLMGNDRIRMTSVRTMDAMKCVKRYGVDAKTLFAGQLDFPEPADGPDSRGG
jgi:uncharacterized membrane protein